MQTVQLLEQKILLGEDVSPDELASAMRLESAANRVAELKAQRGRI